MPSDLVTHPARDEARAWVKTMCWNQLWSLDATKLPGPAKWDMVQLLDRVLMSSAGSSRGLGSTATTESTPHRGSVVPRRVSRTRCSDLVSSDIHADGGAMMKAKSLALLFADLFKNFHQPSATADVHEDLWTPRRTSKDAEVSSEFLSSSLVQAAVHLFIVHSAALLQSRASSQRTGISHARRCGTTAGRLIVLLKVQRRHAASEAGSIDVALHRLGRRRMRWRMLLH